MSILTKEQRQIKSWMKANVEDNLQDNGWEVNCTSLVEDLAWNSGLVSSDILDDETHIAWDLAVDVAEWYEATNE